MSCKFISSKAPFRLRVSNCEVLELCLKLPVIGLPAVVGDKIVCIILIAFMLDLIYGITCFKHDIILVECCLVHAYNTSNGVEKKTKHK